MNSLAIQLLLHLVCTLCVCSYLQAFWLPHNDYLEPSIEDRASMHESDRDARAIWATKTRGAYGSPEKLDSFLDAMTARWFPLRRSIREYPLRIKQRNVRETGLPYKTSHAMRQLAELSGHVPHVTKRDTQSVLQQQDSLHSSEESDNAHSVSQRATWLNIKREGAYPSLKLAAPHFKPLGHPSIRANWLPMKKAAQSNEYINTNPHELNNRASWMSMKKSPEYATLNSIEGRASWRPMKRQDENDQDKRASWMPIKRNTDQDTSLESNKVSNDIKDEDIADSSDKVNHHINKRATWMDFRDGHSKTISAFGHFVNGRASSGYAHPGINSREVGNTYGSDMKGSLRASHQVNAAADEMYHSSGWSYPHKPWKTPQTMYFFPNSDNDKDGLKERAYYAATEKRIPTARAVNNDAKYEWDYFNGRAMWLPTRNVHDHVPVNRGIYARIPTNRDVEYRIPTERGLNYRIPTEREIHSRIPTEDE